MRALWLPRLVLSFPCFFIAWYWLMPFANVIIGAVVHRITSLIVSIPLPGYRANLVELSFIVRGRSIELSIELEPRIYSWGLPLGLSVLFAFVPTFFGR